MTISYVDNYPMFLSITCGSGIAQECLTLGFVEHYSMDDSEWLYIYEIGNKTFMEGSFHTQKSGYYLPYNSYYGDSYLLSTFKSGVSNLFNYMMTIVSQSFNSSDCGLTVQQLGLNV